jgi:hypothetical protein
MEVSIDSYLEGLLLDFTNINGLLTIANKEAEKIVRDGKLNGVILDKYIEEQKEHNEK